MQGTSGCPEVTNEDVSPRPGKEGGRGAGKEGVFIRTKEIGRHGSGWIRVGNLEEVRL